MLNATGALDRFTRRRAHFAHGYALLLLVVAITLQLCGRDLSRQSEEGAYMPLVANNAATRLAASIGTADTTISVMAGTGSSFPSPSAGNWFPVTIVTVTDLLEIAHCTARSGDVLTVTRAQEGTSAKAFTAGDRVELRLTSGVLDSMSGDISGVRSDVTALQGSISSLSSQLTALASLLPSGFGPLPWSLSTEPSGWIFADGRVLTSATPYAALRAAYIADGFPHGQDGSGNPKVPDMRGVVPAGRDNMGGTAAGRLSGATALSAFLGQENVTLTLAQIPSHNHGVTDPGHAHSTYVRLGQSYSGLLYQAGGSADNATYFATVGAATTGISIQNNGGGGAHSNVQPTRVLNYIIKV